MTRSSPGKALGFRPPLPLILLAVGLVALTVALIACGGDDGDGGGEEPRELVGLFRLDPGVCNDTALPDDDPNNIVSGSYFHMTDPAGDGNQSGQSECPNQSYDPLKPGTDGGLITGQYQPHSADPFDADGNSQSGPIQEPRPFFGLLYGTGTQSDIFPGDEGPPSPAPPVPSIVYDPDNGTLSGDISALSITWNNLFFSQGAPRADDPDDKNPTTGEPRHCEDDQGVLTGTYDPDTGAYTLDWNSRIGGSFGCGFVGHWHYEGTFEER